MRRRSTRTLTVAAAAAISLAAAGCTGATSGGDDEGDANSLTWLIEEPEDPEALDALEKHVATFEEESGVDVEIDTLDFQTMRTVLQTQLRSGEGPDVFSWGSGPGFGGALAEAGLIHDVTDAYEEHDWEVYDFAKDRVTIDGKVYGIPGELETIGIFYNKAVFAELGLEEPQSVDDLLAAAEAIKASGRIPFAAGNKEGWQGSHFLSMTLSSAIGGAGMEELFAGERSWDSPEVVEAIELWAQMNEDGYLPESPTSVDYDTSAAQFYSGEAAMIPTGSWLVGEIDDNADFEAGYIPFPAPDGPGVFTGGLGSGPYISANTSSTDAAVEFLDFLASPEHGQWTVENLHTIPPMPLETEDLEVSPLLRQVLDDTAQVAEGAEFGYNIDVMTTDQFNEVMYDGMQAVLTGQQTAEEVAGQLEDAARQ